MSNSTVNESERQDVGPQTAPSDRVPIGQKLAYGLGATNDVWGNWLYGSMIWPVFNIYLHVSPKLVGYVLMITRLVDAVSDPLFGWLSDNTRSKWGRRRPYILVGSILTGLTFPLLFFVGRDWSEMGYFWYMIASSGIFITIVSSFNMPYQSLGSELTPDYNERTSVYSYRTIIQKIPEVGMFFAATFVALRMFNDAKTGKPDMLTGARVYAALAGLVIIVVGIIVFAVVKERYYGKLVETKGKRIAIAESIWKSLRCRPFRAQIAMALAYGLGTGLVGSLGYYATVYYVCGGNVAEGGWWNFRMGLANMAFAVVGVPVFAAIAQRIGKRSSMMMVQVAAVSVFLATWVLYNPEVKWLQILASGGIAFTGAGFWMLYGSMLADVIDYDELETGKRREGAFNACGSWMMKVGMALGLGGSGIVLETTGFDAAIEGAQPEQALLMIRIYLAAIPIVGLVIALIALTRFGLTPSKMAKIRSQLETRRGKV